jgi:hypothetical protein
MFVTTHGGSSVTCGWPSRGLAGEPHSTSTFRSNDLGFQIPPTPPVCKPVPGGGVAAAAKAAAEEEDPSLTRAYESHVLQGFLGQLDSGNDSVWAARMVRAADGYAVGTAIHAATGEEEGFLAHVADSGRVKATLPLVQGTLHMTCPRALLVKRAGITATATAGAPGTTCCLCCHDDCAQCPNVTSALATTVVVVGNGVDVGLDPVLEDVVVAVVRVAGNCMRILSMTLGCGVAWEGTGPARYYDLAWSPFDSGMAFVCGDAPVVASDGLSTVRVAMVALVCIGTGAAVTTLTLPSAAPSTAVSLGVAMSLLAIGVNVEEGGTALLWSVSPAAGEAPFVSVAPYPNPYATQYNDPTTSRLRLPPSVAAVQVTRVVVHTCGGIMVVGRGTVPQPSLFPATVTVVYAFDGATVPLTSFGDLGALVWWPPGSSPSAAVPTDALLMPDGALLITGNASQPGPNAFVHGPACALPYLATTQAAASPQPFVLQVQSCASRAWCCCCCDGTLAPVVRCLLQDLPGCSFARVAAALCTTSPKAFHVVGDVFPHGCGTGAQAAGVLHALVAYTCPRVRVMNAHWTPYCCGGGGGTLCPDDGGPARVDYVCGPSGCASALVVSGPVTVGSLCAGDPEPLPIPGSLVFDPAQGAFLGFDGTAWRKLSWA